MGFLYLFLPLSTWRSDVYHPLPICHVYIGFGIKFSGSEHLFPNFLKVVCILYFVVAEMCGGTSGSSDQPGSQNGEMRLLRALQLLLLLLPTENRVLLKDVLQLLHLTASHEGKNKMSSDSLATLFTPHLLCPRKVQICPYLERNIDML
jgi:hypothetical protein